MVKTKLRGGRLLRATVLWVVLSALEIALVGKLDPQETPVGVAIGLLATLLTVVAAAAAHAHYGGRAAWLWLPLLVARNVARDTIIVSRIVLRRLAGGAVADGYLDIPFDPGGDDALSAGRRALAIAGVSTSPNEIVLDVDPERRTMRVHVLADTGNRRRSAEWPL